MTTKLTIETSSSMGALIHSIQPGDLRPTIVMVPAGREHVLHLHSGTELSISEAHVAGVPLGGVYPAPPPLRAVPETPDRDVADTSEEELTKLAVFQALEARPDVLKALMDAIDVHPEALMLLLKETRAAEASGEDPEVSGDEHDWSKPLSTASHWPAQTVDDRERDAAKEPGARLSEALMPLITERYTSEEPGAGLAEAQIGTLTSEGAAQIERAGFDNATDPRLVQAVTRRPNTKVPGEHG